MLIDDDIIRVKFAKHANTLNINKCNLLFLHFPYHIIMIYGRKLSEIDQT